MRTRDGPFQPLVHHPPLTRWLETDNPDKLLALEKSGLKLYIEKAESIRPVLGRVWHLVWEFWENFENGCSTVLGQRISVAEQDISRATGLPNRGQTVGGWVRNNHSIAKQIGKKAWKARRVMRLKMLLGVETKFMEKFSVDMIKDDSVRYVASLVMEHLSGFAIASHCSDQFLDAIEEGINGNVTKWTAHIRKRMRLFKRKSLISREEGYKYQFPYGVVILLLVREQAPHLWQQAIENEEQDIELLKKGRLNEINGVQESESKKRRLNEINGVLDIEEGRMNEINGNGFEMGNLKGEGKIEDVEGDLYGEKRPKLPLALVDLEEDGESEDSKEVQMQEVVERKEERGSEDDKGVQMQAVAESEDWRSEDSKVVQMQDKVEREEEGVNGLDYQVAGAVLQRIKAGLAEECAETVEQYLLNREGWITASVLEVSDGELLEQYYSDLKFRSGDHDLENPMHGIPTRLSRRDSVLAAPGQRNKMKKTIGMGRRRRGRKYAKLLVISIEYVLAQFVHKSKVPFAQGDLYVDPYIVFIHPQACRFLSACLSVFKVAVWSEKPRVVHDLVLQHILGGIPSSGQILSYSIEDCTMTKINREGNQFHGCYKDLTSVWEDQGDYGCKETLLVDTSHVAMLRNKNGNVICPIPYQYHVQASHWQLETYLLPYLECLQSLQNIPKFVNFNPFGLEKGYSWQRSQCEGGRVTPLFATPRPRHCLGIAQSWKMFPITVTGTSNSQLDLLNTQLPGICNTGQQFPITRTSMSFSQPVSPAANLGIFEVYHGNSSRVSPGFNDHIKSDNDMNYMRGLIRQSDDNMKYIRELNQVKVDLQNMAYEKYKLEKNLQEKEDHLQKVVEAFKKLNEEKKIAEDENSDLSKAFVERDRALEQVNQVKVDLQNMTYEKYKLEKKLQEKEDHLQKVVDAYEKLNKEKKIAEDENNDLSKAFVERDRALEQVKLEKSLEMKHKEKIICSLQETVQALQEKLGRFEQKQREFQILVKREVEKETAQIRSTLTDILGLKQGVDLVVGAQKQVEELKRQWKVKHQLKPDHFMLVISSDVEQSTEEPYQQAKNKGTSSHMNGDKRTGAISNLLLTSDTEALHCSICMEEWTTTGDHRICSLACGHMFGMSCIREWLQRHENNIGKCPQCNDKAKLTDIRTLYVPVIAVTGLQ